MIQASVTSPMTNPLPLFDPAVLARIAAGVHADPGAAQRGCFLVRRHSTSGEGGKVKSPFQILVGGSRILAQKVQ